MDSDTEKQFKSLFTIDDVGTLAWLEFHVKLLSNNDEQICNYCHSNNPKRIKFELPCGHHMHCKCTVKCLFNNKLNCVICGPIEEMENNSYCSSCDKWGQCATTCINKREYPDD